MVRRILLYSILSLLFAIIFLAILALIQKGRPDIAFVFSCILLGVITFLILTEKPDNNKNTTKANGKSRVKNSSGENGKWIRKIYTWYFRVFLTNRQTRKKYCKDSQSEDTLQKPFHATSPEEKP